MKRLFARWLGDNDAPSQTPQANARSLGELQRKLDIARAVEDERSRIHDDLHDDIGGKLLTLLHRVREPEQQQLVREVLQDLRAILARSRGAEGTLLEVLALLREEAEHRLDTHAITLDWQQADTLPDPMLDQAQAMHLFRIGREAITNALRHAHPQHLRVLVDEAGGHLLFEVTDDGHFDPGRIGSGRGTRSMQSRAGELQGDISWQAGTLGGTKVRLRFPLPPTAGTPATAGWEPNK